MTPFTEASYVLTLNYN